MLVQSFRDTTYGEQPALKNYFTPAPLPDAASLTARDAAPLLAPETPFEGCPAYGTWGQVWDTDARAVFRQAVADAIGDMLSGRNARAGARSLVGAIAETEIQSAVLGRLLKLPSVIHAGQSFADRAWAEYKDSRMHDLAQISQIRSQQQPL